MHQQDGSTMDRPNLTTAEIVEFGLVLQASETSSSIAMYLEERGVPFNVIVRVLAEPPRRRGTRTMLDRQEPNRVFQAEFSRPDPAKASGD